MSYLTFFSFTDEPFRLTPDRDFFFPAANHTALEEVIRYGLEQGEGFIIVSGEVGTGKTMLLRMMLSRISAAYDVALLLSPSMLPRELLLAIMRDIGLEDQARQESGFDNLLRHLNNHLYELAKADKRLLVVIDEAQNLPDESIEQLRLLSNFESDKRKLMQILLVGQPELQEKIEQPHLRQLLQRASIVETLNPLSATELGQYIHFRLNRAGRGDLRLNRRSCQQIYRYTGGTPRLINKLMNRALLVAYAGQSHSITPAIIKEAAVSLKLTRAPATVQAFPWPLATAGIFLLVALTLLTTGDKLQAMLAILFQW